MLDKFRELETKHKIGALCLLVAAVGFIVIVMLGVGKNSNTPAPEPEPTATSAPAPTETATAEPTSSASATATPSPTPTSTITFGVTDLKDSDIRALQTAGEEGVLNFYRWDIKESAKDRQARYAKYFVKGSEFLTKAPDMKDTSLYSDSEGSMISLGSVDYINPVGGTAKGYRMTMGVVLRSQYNYNESLTEKSSVIEKSLTIVVEMAKENGAWKIKSLEEAN